MHVTSFSIRQSLTSPRPRGPLALIASHLIVRTSLFLPQHRLVLLLMLLSSCVYASLTSLWPKPARSPSFIQSFAVLLLTSRTPTRMTSSFSWLIHPQGKDDKIFAYILWAIATIFVVALTWGFVSLLIHCHRRKSKTSKPSDGEKSLPASTSSSAISLPCCTGKIAANTTNWPLPQILPITPLSLPYEPFDKPSLQQQRFARYLQSWGNSKAQHTSHEDDIATAPRGRDQSSIALRRSREVRHLDLQKIIAYPQHPLAATIPVTAGYTHGRRYIIH